MVYRYPAIRPDTIAIPFGQGHSAYGRYAQGRGVNPALLGLKLNGAGDLAYGSTRVKIEKMGRKQPLSRMESRTAYMVRGWKNENTRRLLRRGLWAIIRGDFESQVGHGHRPGLVHWLSGLCNGMCNGEQHILRR